MSQHKNSIPQQKHAVAIRQQQFFSGPVPDPDSLSKYEQISPGFADRILSMAETEQRERINTNNKIIETEKFLGTKETNNFRRGQIFALLAVILVSSLCAYAFYLGCPKEGRDIAVAVIIGIAGIFITGKYIKKKQ